MYVLQREETIMTHIILHETTKEFKKGFEFCTKAIYDLTRKNDYKIETLNELLSSMITLMDSDSYWNDIKKAILCG